MKIRDMVIMGLRNLFRRKARTSLTVIGMAIGIVLIMVLASISIGVRQTIDRYIMENGQMSIITISSSSGSWDEDGNYQRIEQKIDDRVIEQVKSINHVKAISPIIYKSINMKSGKYTCWGQLCIMDSSTFADFDFPALEIGSYPTPENNVGFVFGSETMRWNQFYYWSGNSQKTKDVDFTREKVSFVFDDYQWEISEKKKQEEFLLENYAKMEPSENYMFSWYIYMDLEYYKTLMTKHANTLKPQYRKKLLAELEEYQNIQINVDNMRNVTSVEEEIQKLGYKTQSNMQYIQPMIDTADMLQNVLIGIGLVAMLVSAINIANTMIMSIYERTREIGIMKVLGCLISDVKKLFLFEAAVLGLIGGVFGIGISYLCSYLINKYGSEFLGSLIMSGMSEGNKASVIPWWLPFVISIFAIVIGVVSGYMPARRATKISAIEAMKSES